MTASPPPCLNDGDLEASGFITPRLPCSQHERMHWTPAQLDQALSRLGAAVPALMAKYPEPRAFAAAFWRAAAPIEEYAGHNEPQVRRRIEALLAAMVQPSLGAGRGGSPALTREPRY